MATTTRIVIQQAVNLDTNNITAGKYPRFVVSLGFSVTGVTINDLTNAIQETANNAGAAAASATAAKASQDAAKTSETNAKTSETNAKASETASKTSETNAKTSETNALASKNAAKTSETNAKTSETNAKTSETAAKTSETNAKTSETNALASKNAAAASQTAAKTSETNAKTSETNALASKNAAADSQTAAAGSAAAALDSKNAAADSQTAAKTSETNSKTSETNAKASETAAAASQTAAAGSEAAALDSKNAAAASQTAAKTSQTAAKTSETNAKTSETNALASKNAAATSATNAATSETNALESKNAAKTSETNAKTSETNAKTSETNAKTSETSAATSATNAATSETNALESKNAAAASQTAAKTSETNALASKNAAKTSETNAKTSETNAKASEIAAAASAASIITYEPVPYPDVWIPLNDDLRLLAGFAPYEQLNINGKILELPWKSISHNRGSTATYIDKSGVLQTAGINEPRFERAGFLLEGQSTNYTLNSEAPLSWSGTSTAFGTKNVIQDGTTRATTFDGVITLAGTNNASVVFSSLISCAVGEFITLSCRFKSAYTKGYMLFRFDSPAGTNQGQLGLNFDGTTANNTIPGILVRVENTLGSDGYCYGAVTCKVPVAGDYMGRIYFMPGGGDTSIPVGSEVFVQTVQCEKNAVATSYIPTTTSTATRAHETLSLQPSNNLGYRIVGDTFNRTVALEISADRFSPPTANYHDLIRVPGVSNDIIMRVMATSIRAYRASGGPVVSATHPFYNKIYIQTIDSSNKMTLYFDGNSNFTFGDANGPSTAPQRLEFAGASSIVYHLRNFRIWHRVLTEDQIRGIR